MLTFGRLANPGGHWSLRCGWASLGPRAPRRSPAKPGWPAKPCREALTLDRLAQVCRVIEWGNPDLAAAVRTSLGAHGEVVGERSRPAASTPPTRPGGLRLAPQGLTRPPVPAEGLP